MQRGVRRGGRHLASCWWRCSSRWRSSPAPPGAIYRQFALTIAASVALSTFCALTLTPALSRACCCASTQGEKWIFFRRVDQALDAAARAATRRCCGGCCGARSLVVAGALRCAARRHRACCSAPVPTGFIPDEDQGYFIIAVQGPEGMSLAQTEKVHAAGGEGAATQPEVQRHVRHRRLLASGARARTRGTSSSTSSRGRSARARSQRVAGDGGAAARAASAASAGARVLPFQPPAIRGVGSVGGFQFIVEDSAGDRSLDELAAGARRGARWRGATRTPELRGVFTTFNARRRRCSTWRWTARRRRRWACRWIRSSARCSSTWAAST